MDLPRNYWLIPASLVIAVIVIALLGPSEATLGTTIRWVYVHVAFIWSGSLTITALGLAGLFLMTRPKSRVGDWFFAVEAVGIGLFTTGFVLSLISAAASWGAVLWQEPRVLSSFIVVGAGLSAVLLIRSLENRRMVGATALALAVMVNYSLAVTGRVFHPDNPIGASDSSLIKMTFIVLAVVALALGLSLVPIIGRLSNPKRT